MNGKVSKRIRHAARITSKHNYRARCKELKREYKLLPYHRRKTPVVESHSTVLRRLQGLQGALA